MLLGHSTSPAIRLNDIRVSKTADSEEHEIHLYNLVFTGAVTQLENGQALITWNATYLLSGDDFEKMTGKQVNVIGKLEKEDAVETIRVIRYQLVNGRWPVEIDSQK